MVDEFGATSAGIGAHAVVQHFGDGGQRPLQERGLFCKVLPAKPERLLQKQIHLVYDLLDGIDQRLT